MHVLVEGLPIVVADCGGKDCEIEWTQSEIGLFPAGEESLYF